MSLPIGQRHDLESIEGKLAESDPRHVSLFSIYRLGALAYWFLWMARRPASRIRAMVLLPAALTAVACALTIAFGFPGSQRHVPGSKAPAARELVVRSRDRMAKAWLCRPRNRIPAFPACAC